MYDHRTEVPASAVGAVITRDVVPATRAMNTIRGRRMQSSFYRLSVHTHFDAPRPSPCDTSEPSDGPNRPGSISPNHRYDRRMRRWVVPVALLVFFVSGCGKIN